MYSKLFISIGTVALIGLSSIAYGGWTKYASSYTPGAPVPTGDCLEMMCQYGCVENEQGRGYCCSAGQLGDKCLAGLCCQKGLICSNSVGEGTCVACLTDEDCEGEEICLPNKICGCAEGTTSYVKSDNTTGCCDNARVVCGTQCCEEGYVCSNGQCVTPCPSPLPTYGQSCTSGCGCLNSETTGLICSTQTQKCTCSDKQKWDDKQKKCVTKECTKDEDCNGNRMCNLTDGVCCPENKPAWNGTKCVECLNHRAGYYPVRTICKDESKPFCVNERCTCDCETNLPDGMTCKCARGARFYTTTRPFTWDETSHAKIKLPAQTFINGAANVLVNGVGLSGQTYHGTCYTDTPLEVSIYRGGSVIDGWIKVRTEITEGAAPELEQREKGGYTRCQNIHKCDSPKVYCAHRISGNLFCMDPSYCRN